MYFIALVCPSNVNEKIWQYKKWMQEQFGCTAALKSPAHITLIPPFWLPGDKEDKLRAEHQSFSGTIGELLIRLTGFSHFGKRVLFVAVENTPQLELLKQQAEQHFVTIFPAIKKETKPFHPHITIANRDMKPAHFEKAWTQFSGRNIDDLFVINTSSLLKFVDGRWNIIS